MYVCLLGELSGSDVSERLLPRVLLGAQLTDDAEQLLVLLLQLLDAPETHVTSQNRVLRSVSH